MIRSLVTLEKNAAVKTRAVDGVTFSIDRPKGTHRVFRDGREWTYPCDYGFFRGRTGEDGEALDAFVGTGGGTLLESFLKLRREEGTGRMVPDETKFLVRVTEAEREAIYSFYGREVANRTVYPSWDSMMDDADLFLNFRRGREGGRPSDADLSKAATVRNPVPRVPDPDAVLDIVRRARGSRKEALEPEREDRAAPPISPDAVGEAMRDIRRRTMPSDAGGAGDGRLVLGMEWPLVADPKGPYADGLEILRKMNPESPAPEPPLTSP